jgi:predicted aspartyl protease
LLLILFIISSFLVISRNFYRQDDLIIPVEYLNSYQIPCTSIEIEGTRYSVEVDLGSKTALSLHKSVLDKMRKTLCGTIRRIDFRGNKYETSAYIIPKIKMGSLLLKKIKAKEESVHFLNEGSIVIIPFVIQQSVLGRVQSVENQLKKMALYYTNTMPLFLIDLSTAFNPAQKPILESRAV